MHRERGGDRPAAAAACRARRRLRQSRALLRAAGAASAVGGDRDQRGRDRAAGGGRRFAGLGDRAATAGRERRPRNAAGAAVPPRFARRDGVAGRARLRGAVVHAGRPLLEAVADLSRRINREFTFDPESTSVTTPLSEVPRSGTASARTSPTSRSPACAFGLPARYVSGYLETVPPPAGAPRGRRRIARVVRGLRARRRMGRFRPHQRSAADRPARHHRVGRDYSDVAPLKGVIFGGGPHLDVSVDMERLFEIFHRRGAEARRYPDCSAPPRLCGENFDVPPMAGWRSPPRRSRGRSSTRRRNGATASRRS